MNIGSLWLLHCSHQGEGLWRPKGKRPNLQCSECDGGPCGSGCNICKWNTMPRPSTALIRPLLIKAHYLLVPDSELQAVGNETKIPYEEYYDFYLQYLLKHSNWAIETITLFNLDLFGSKAGKSSGLTEVEAPSAPPNPGKMTFLTIWTVLRAVSKRFQSTSDTKQAMLT